MSMDKKIDTTRKSIKYIPEMGSEAFSVLMTPNLKQYFRTYTPHSLIFQTAWIVAMVSDDDGQKYSIFRAYKAEDSISVLACKHILGLDHDPERLFLPNRDMYIGRAYHEMDEKNGRIVIEPFTKSGQTFNITIRPQHLIWKDASDRMDLEFKAMGPALEFYIPGRIEADCYRTELFSVSGTLNGRKVTGRGNYDSSYGPPGYGFGHTKIYQALEKAWLNWGTFYEDGGFEGGVVIDGTDKFEIGYYIRDGQARITRNNTFEARTTAEGYITGARFKMDDLEFEYKTDSWLMRDPVRWTSHASGPVINKNETRKPLQSYSIMEFFPKR